MKQYRSNHFIPITIEECKALGYDRCDIIFITGDAYIDSPFIGVAILARFLEQKGFKIGIIPQPDVNNLKDITRLGQPRLFWGVTAGSIDSMVANYTALLKKRKSDDLTPGGLNNKRPDRATIVYTNLIRKAYKNTSPIIIGGIEASNRRIAHYDYWTNKIRRSILFDSKADILVYGMAEFTLLDLANISLKLLEDDHLVFTSKVKNEFIKINGICYIDKEIPENKVEIPSYEEVAIDKEKFALSHLKFFEYIDKINLLPENLRLPLVQKHDQRYLVHNPLPQTLSQEQIDQIYELPFLHDAHPLLKKIGKIKALDTIPFSITTHRGCFGGCNFCSIAIHQGKTVVSRSQKSILKEATYFSTLQNFNGIIRDVGGPTANMYGVSCSKFENPGSCKRKSCLFPSVCKFLLIDHVKIIDLLNKIKKIDGIKKVFIASGIRYDLLLADKNSDKYLKSLISEYTSGQFKIAPEHTEDNVLKLMGKPPNKILLSFITFYQKIFNSLKEEKQYFNSKRLDSLKKEKPEKRINKYISFYLIAAYPGCKVEDMLEMKNKLDKFSFIDKNQVQIFTPLPLTYSSLQYYLGKDLTFDKKIYVEKDLKKKKQQKDILFL